MGNLSFNNIPQNLRVPLFSQKSTTAAPIPARQRNALIIGQMTSQERGSRYAGDFPGHR